MRSNMKILSKYQLKDFFVIFAASQLIFFTIYLLIDFLGKIDNFIEAEVSKDVMASYFLYKSPFILVQMTPVASLISAVILFCIMKRHNEITALRASGFSIFHIARPILLGTLFIAGGLFFLSEFIVPYTSSRSNEIWAVEVEKRDPTRFYESNQLWYRGEKAIYWARHFDYRRRILDSPSLYFFDEAFRLTKKIDALKGTWDGNGWRFEDGIVQELTPEGGYRLRRFNEIHLDLPETPQTFVRNERQPEEMSYWQLKVYAEKVRREGYDDTRYRVDMYIKLALPFMSLILVFAGIPISLGLRRGGTALAVSMGIGLCFIYLLLLGFSRSLGLSGTLPPFFAAWLASAVFLLLGIYLMMRIERWGF